MQDAVLRESPSVTALLNFADVLNISLSKDVQIVFDITHSL